MYSSFFIIPGVIAKFTFDAVREKAISESNEIRSSLQNYCSGSAREPANEKD
jgi:hypothetical protein